MTINNKFQNSIQIEERFRKKFNSFFLGELEWSYRRARKFLREVQAFKKREDAAGQFK